MYMNTMQWSQCLCVHVCLYVCVCVGGGGGGLIQFYEMCLANGKVSMQNLKHGSDITKRCMDWLARHVKLYSGTSL